jgi:large subunit ribosomal protein L2
MQKNKLKGKPNLTRIRPMKHLLQEPTKSGPIKHLLQGLTKSGGRNNTGRTTVFHRGGGHKRRYRQIDFKRYSLSGHVKAIEYDPNRSAHLARIITSKGKECYILAPENLTIGMPIFSGEVADIKVGNSLRVRDIPIGTFLHNIEIKPGKGAQFIRSAGCKGQLLQKTEKYCKVRLPSGENYVIPSSCYATIGTISNSEHQNKVIGKAGRSRWLSRRPVVRGVAMNPIDHPHGGGEGKTSGGRPSVTPWGRPTKGQPTRRNKRKRNKI